MIDLEDKLELASRERQAREAYHDAVQRGDATEARRCLELIRQLRREHFRAGWRQAR